MKHNSLDKFIQRLSSLNMTESEKATMRERLASFVVGSFTPRVSPYHRIVLMTRQSVAIAFIFLFSVGSVSGLISKSALPGDTLYPVKIAHEEITLATLVGTKKKITYGIRRTEKRIQEATKMAQNHELDLEAQSDVALTIKKQSDEVRERIQEIKHDDPEVALVLNSELKSTMKINNDFLRDATTTIEHQRKGSPEVHLLNFESSEENPRPLSEELNSENELFDEEGEYVEVEVSSAETLIESIEEQVRALESVEETAEETLVEGENTEADANEISDEASSSTPESHPEIDSNPKELLVENIHTLEDILKVKEQIKELKGDSLEFELYTDKETGIVFDEQQLREEAETFMEQEKYKNAFVNFQKILEYYTAQDISKEVSEDLGLAIPPSDEISSLSSSSTLSLTSKR